MSNTSAGEQMVELKKAVEHFLEVFLDPFLKIIPNWAKPKNEVEFDKANPPVIYKTNDSSIEKFAEDYLSGEAFQEAYRTIFNDSFNVVKDAIDESLLAEYNNVPGWHRK